jgi:hypothetical protein
MIGYKNWDFRDTPKIISFYFIWINVDNLGILKIQVSCRISNECYNLRGVPEVPALNGIMKPILLNTQARAYLPASIETTFFFVGQTTQTVKFALGLLIGNISRITLASVFIRSLQSMLPIFRGTNSRRLSEKGSRP